MKAFRVAITVMMVLALGPMVWGGNADPPRPTAWYAADDISLSQGDPVSSWADRSGHGLDLATQNQDPCSPVITFKNNIYNSLPGISLPGGTRPGGLPLPYVYMRTEERSPLLQGPGFHLFAVHKAYEFFRGGTALLAVSQGDGTEVMTNALLMNQDNGGVYARDPASPFPDSYARCLTNQWQNGVSEILSTGNIPQQAGVAETDLMTWWDGAGPLATPDWVAGTPQPHTAVDRMIHVGAGWWSEGRYIWADICEVIVYNRPLTEAERQQVGAYLTGKYNLLTNYAGQPSSDAVLINETLWYTQVAEEGTTTDTYTIRFNDANLPASDVVITVDPDTQVEVNNAGAGNSVQLTFTAADGNQPQTVTVRAINDAFSEGQHTGTITHTTPGMILDSVVVDVLDNDVIDISLEPNALSAAEGGAGNTYEITIAGAPLQAVTVTVDPDNQLEVNSNGQGASIELTFTSVNWATPQTVTVTAYDDGDSEGPHQGIITNDVQSGDPQWDVLTLPNVVVSITDNEYYCGEPGQYWLDGDIAGPNGTGAANRDCYVNMLDFAHFASQWLQCSDRFYAQCVQW